MRLHREEASRRRAAAFDDGAPAVRKDEPVQAVVERVDTGTKRGIHTGIIHLRLQLT
jgi:hypothetical protein